MRREIPIILTIVFLLVRALFELIGPLYDFQITFPDGTKENLFTSISNAVVYMSVVALFMGVWNLTRNHVGNIRRKRENWPYSIWLLVVLYAYAIIGIVEGMEGKHFEWIYTGVIVPLDSTTFSLLAFFIASAAYRAFRVRSLEAGLMMVVAFIIMMGNTSLGNAIWSQTSWLGGFKGIRDWLMNVPNGAGFRAINLGLFIGAYVTAVRVALGLERRYLGVD
ncbi:MAG TPA: hypothetical protein GX510_02755 [Firmicutes bacterium]|nr:hypothetical protein [Candidatus Fermentithermobacillaceae bacterium]